MVEGKRLVMGIPLQELFKLEASSTPDLDFALSDLAKSFSFLSYTKLVEMGGFSVVVEAGDMLRIPLGTMILEANVHGEAVAAQVGEPMRTDSAQFGCVFVCERTRVKC